MDKCGSIDDETSGGGVSCEGVRGRMGRVTVRVALLLSNFALPLSGSIG